jgi:aspartate/methionine/tyrosine aminotransferase
MANVPGMWDRTVTVTSAGKMFAATGIKVGFVIGPRKLLEGAEKIDSFSKFCMFAPVQLAIADSLEIALKEGYFLETQDKYYEARRLLMDAVV